MIMASLMHLHLLFQHTDGVTGTFIPYFKIIGQRILPPKKVTQLRYTKSVIVKLKQGLASLDPRLSVKITVQSFCPLDVVNYYF